MKAALKPDLFIPKAGKGSPASPSPARFMKGKEYQFRSAHYKDVTPFHKTGVSSVRFRFLSREQGQRA
jgi:hypothetical protein